MMNLRPTESPQQCLEATREIHRDRDMREIWYQEPNSTLQLLTLELLPSPCEITLLSSLSDMYSEV